MDRAPPANLTPMTGDLTARVMFAGRSSSLSAQVVAEVRDALVRQAAQARRLSRHREGPRRPLQGEPHRGARRAAHAGGARHRRNPHGQGRRRAHRPRQSAAVRRGARRAARPHRRERRRDHGRAARHRDARRRTRGRERDAPTTWPSCAACCKRRKRPSATSTNSPGCRAISIWRSPRPRTTACSSCSSSRSSTCRGRAATSPPRRSWRGTFSTFTRSSPT